MEEQVIETWNIHNRISLYLLEALPEEALSDALTPKSRNVYALFAHSHNVRLMWLKAAAPDLMETLTKLETKPVGTKAQLETALKESGEAIEALFRRSMAAGGTIKGFRNYLKTSALACSLNLCHLRNHRSAQATLTKAR